VEECMENALILHSPNIAVLSLMPQMLEMAHYHTIIKSIKTK